MGIKSICSAFDISRNTVRRYVRMYQDSGIPAEKLPSLSDARLQELFAIPGARERKPSERQVRLEALLPDYAARLSRKGMTVKKLYEEYHTGHLESGADADYLPGADADGNDRQTPSHRNIRGKEYFAASIKLSANNNEQHGNEQ